jgi:hypothetical protein
VLMEFMDGLDFVHMKPDNAVVKSATITKDAKATVRALAEPGMTYAVYVKGGVKAELTLDLTKGVYKAEWVNTKTGAVDKAEDFDHAGGARLLVSPAYEEDIALRIKAK